MLKHEKASARARRYARLTAFTALVAAVALVLIPIASESNGGDGLQAFVDASTRGPLTTGGVVWEFVYVSNGNRLTSAIDGQFRARDTLHNAFVVKSVESHIFVDGAEFVGDTYYPPPNEYPRTWAGHWPSTLKCPDTGACNVIGSPAVVPGEKAAVLFAGWGHGPGEPNGKYIFKYTVHGTLNGIPVDVTAQSQPISMTD
jgi:hypothetical protein